MATLLKQDGTREEIAPANGKKFDIEELYKLIDGDMVEIIYLNNSGVGNALIFIGDENARQGPESLNIMATNEYCTSWGIANPLALVGPIQPRGVEVTDLPGGGVLIDCTGGNGEKWDEYGTIHGNIVICKRNEF